MASSGRDTTGHVAEHSPVLMRQPTHFHREPEPWNQTPRRRNHENEKTAYRSAAGVGLADRITVQDTGTGIPGEDLLKIFEPLYSTKGFGVGLGLALAKQVIGQHKGKINVTSKLGAGTNVFLLLPLTQAST